MKSGLVLQPDREHEDSSGRALAQRLGKCSAATTARGARCAQWADSALYDAWRLAESLQTASDDHLMLVDAHHIGVRMTHPDRPGPSDEGQRETVGHS
jgi:hypothetical protein